MEGITMQTEIIEKTIEVRDQLEAEVKRVKEAVAGAVDNGIVAAKRAVKQGRRAAEDLVDDAEYQVKQHPFSAVGVSFGIGIGLGAAIGALLMRNGGKGNGNGRNGKGGEWESGNKSGKVRRNRTNAVNGQAGIPLGLPAANRRRRP